MPADIDPQFKVPKAIKPHEPSDFFQAADNHPPTDLVIVDFDETLWLRNSTEEFLSSVRPRFLAAMVLQVLGFIRPWKLLQRGSPNHYRDWIRVLAVLTIAPWSLWLWRRRAADLGPRLVNRPLLEALQKMPGDKVQVVSFGFRQVVAPLLAAIDPKLTLFESCSLGSGAKLRIDGKALALHKHAGAEVLRRALVITDSEADRDLLQASDKAFLVQWPDAHYEQAGLRPLMPFVYLQRVKRPDENYVRDAILGHDWPVLILAFALVSTTPLLVTGAILLYVLAFFTAYEIGYVENDRLGLQLEKKPKVSPNFHALAPHFSPGFAWFVAVAVGGLASALVYDTHSWVPAALGLQGVPGFLAVWAAFIAFLLAMRLLFRWQAVIAPEGRIVPLLGLQVGRVLGYAVIFSTTIVGASFCIAHGISRWIPYVVYRFGGSRKTVPNHLNCLLVLVVIAGAIAIGGNASAFLNWQSALIFAYVTARAAKELLAFGNHLRPLRR